MLAPHHGISDGASATRQTSPASRLNLAYQPRDSEEYSQT